MIYLRGCIFLLLLLLTLRWCWTCVLLTWILVWRLDLLLLIKTWLVCDNSIFVVWPLQINVSCLCSSKSFSFLKSINNLCFDALSMLLFSIELNSHLHLFIIPLLLNLPLFFSPHFLLLLLHIFDFFLVLYFLIFSNSLFLHLVVLLHLYFFDDLVLLLFFFESEIIFKLEEFSLYLFFSILWNLFNYSESIFSLANLLEVNAAIASFAFSSTWGIDPWESCISWCYCLVLASFVSHSGLVLVNRDVFVAVQASINTIIHSLELGCVIIESWALIGFRILHQTLILWIPNTYFIQLLF